MLRAIISEMEYPVEIVYRLRIIGYEYNFELVGNKLHCLQTKQFYLPRDLQVDEIFQFERYDKCMQGYYLYALRNSDNSVMGIFSIYPVAEFVDKPPSN